MKRFKIFLLALLAAATGLIAQTANDAITFGQYYHGGTARYMAMGGAFNALGGDFSTLSVNPAGLGIYRSNEFVFTTDLQFNNTTTDFSDNALSPNDASISDTKSNFNFNNFGYVSHSQLADEGLVSINFGVGYNRLKNYHKAYRTTILDASHSLTDNWAMNINQNGLDNATTAAYVADQAYLLNSVDRVNFTSPLLGDATTDYIKDVKEEGKIDEWVFALGGNVGHTIYFGATVGLQNIKMRKEYYQTEYFLNVDVPGSIDDGYSYLRHETSATDRVYTANDQDYFNYYSEEFTEGLGVNGKFGLIIRPLDMFRFGVAIHTPTVNFLTVDHYADMFNNTYYIDENGAESAGGEGFEDKTAYNYRTISPYKVHASAAVILGKFLAVDAELDMVDYSSMKIKDNDGRSYLYEDANEAIADMYKVAYNARAGAELKLHPAFSLRAGVAYYGSPYESNYYTDALGNNLDAADYVGDRFDYSGGFGFRVADFYMDLAYIHSILENSSFVYDGAISPNEYYEMDLEHQYNRFMMTMGFKF